MEYFVGLISIITINLILSGDNALVIALASRRLPEKQQRLAILFGGAGAIIFRILLTFAAIFLLQISYLQLLGGLLLLWIAIKLVKQENEGENITAADNLAEAVKTIIIADVVMSLDNVIAIAGVAKGNIMLLVIGLAISIPIIIWGSKAIQMLMEKWPIIILLGAAFLGWTAGDMVVSDPKVAPLLITYGWLEEAVAVTFAALVLIAGTMAERKKVR